MKKKSLLAGFALLICLSFGANSAFATPPHQEHPGGGGYTPPPVKCTKYPCPERP